MSVGEPKILWQETIDILEARAITRGAEDEEARKRGKVVLRGWIPPQSEAWLYEEVMNLSPEERK